MDGLDIYIHRGGAKGAENIYYMFAVDPPKILVDRKDGEHKEQSFLCVRNTLCVTN
jgi:hypothetical protein